jgi:citryl-CoA lyase
VIKVPQKPIYASQLSFYIKKVLSIPIIRSTPATKTKKYINISTYVIDPTNLFIDIEKHTTSTLIYFSTTHINQSNISHYMTWNTAIAEASKDNTTIRGYKLEECMEKLTFTQMIFLIWKGELPTKEEEAMFTTLLIATTEHGITPPSITAARNAYSGSGQMNSAVAAGLLAIGKHHGGAMEQCARLIHEHVDIEFKDRPVKEIATHIVDNMVERKQRIPGFGHKIYTTDPRAETIFKKAEQCGFKGKYVETVQAIESYLEEKKGKKFCINVDGAIAAVLLEMGFDWKIGMGFFLLPRTAGIIAHVHEEAVREKPFRRLTSAETSYDGPKEREL